MNHFTAGQVSDHLSAWEELTSDPEILQIVQGDTIVFSSDPPERQVVRNYPIRFGSNTFVAEVRFHNTSR